MVARGKRIYDGQQRAEACVVGAGEVGGRIWIEKQGLKVIEIRFVDLDRAYENGREESNRR